MSLVITKDNFEAEVKNSDVPVVIDFWAAWCGPCKMMGPVVDQLSDELEGQVKVGKVNVDEQPELAAQFGVIGGEEVKRSVGQLPKDMLKAQLEI